MSRPETDCADLRGKYAIVTGASHGIGRAVAEALAGAGCNLHLLCRSDIDALRAAASDLCTRYGVYVTADQVDVSDPDAVRAFYEHTGKDVSFLINNAGISYVGLLQEMTDADWDRVIGTNLSSVFYFCRGAIPVFLRRGEGRIINISSVWGTAGASNEVAYSASKGGMNALTRALGKELAPNHIPVNAIACGVVDTRMNGCFDAEEKKALAEEIPAGRFAKPAEIADAVLSLLRMPDYLTGQILTIDGGWI